MKLKNKDEVKSRLTELLLQTKREGVEDLVAYMDDIGFWDAPASSCFHESFPGGLAAHTAKVYNVAIATAKALDKEGLLKNVPTDSLVLTTILHDLGKCGQFGMPLYKENFLKDGKQSEAKPYQTNKDLRTLPHEVVSVIEATKFIDLKAEEQQAIAWHNGLYTNSFKYDIPGNEFPLYLILHFADMWASRFMKEDN